ncbi:MAG: cytochrome c biogenesis protein CcdA [Prevotellaceae bacterium]|nr:cytochrome c biogenesis protein CcdA [Prevotellaceae bacterium]
MIQRLIIMLFSMMTTVAYGQANFTWNVTKVSDNELLLTVSGTLEEGWHVSDRFIRLEGQDGVTLKGGLQQDEGDGTVVYRQHLAVEKGGYLAKGYLQYILCTETMCLAPQTVEFEYRGAMAQQKQAEQTAKAVGRDTAQVPQPLADAAVRDTAADASPGILSSAAWQPVTEQLASFTASTSKPITNNQQPNNQSTLWTLVLLAFCGGLLALLTPCVWPMIPLTVSFFMKRGMGVRGAALFGASIIVIFMLLGVAVTMLLGADALNKLATDAVFNVVCFVVLVAFGLSLLGMFELRLPSSWANSLDSRSSTTTGVVSIFLMALTLVVVSFSCTAPVIGLLLVEIATNRGGLLMPLAGMGAFALALALPFTFFALFPRLLQRLPRSGNWMTSVRVTLGFLEIAFALKFLSVADMAYGWNILPRRVFIALWIVIAFACGVYHSVDWTRRRINPLRRQKVAIVCYAFVFYLIPGLHGAPCTLVSAFLPPVERVEEVFTDYEEALEEARRQGKPLFIDFTGYGCVNCRKMEAAVFTDPRVRDILYNDFVVAQLYVDDRTPLPATMNAGGRTLRTVGDKWALLETHKFGYAAQPFYVIVDADGKPLTRSYAYDESAERFLEWLRSGLPE